MSLQQDEITTLLKQIEGQDELINKLQQEEQKLSAYVQQFKQAMKQRNTKQSSISQKSAIDQQKIQKQLQKQLQNAKNMLKNYQHELKVLQKKSTKNKFTSDDLLELQNNVKIKEQQVKQLNQDIKNLGIVKRRQQKMIDKKQKNEDGIKLSKLVQEIRKQKQQLEILQSKHKHKRQILQKRKIVVQQLQKQYKQKCKKYGEKALNFQQFKERRLQKKRQQSVKKIQNEQKKDPKKFLSVKDIINSHLDIQNIQISQKGLIQLKQKKVVAQNSLKIAKKKYEKQIQELEERLEQLKIQNENLNKKYLQKKKERQLTETSKNIDFKKNSSKTMRKLDPIK